MGVCIVLSPSGEVIVTDADVPEPALVVVPEETSQSSVPLRGDVHAIALPSSTLHQWAQEQGHRVGTIRDFPGPNLVTRAAAVLRNQGYHKYHPTTGLPLHFDDAGIVARDTEGAEVFPRLNPAVIGLVRLAGTDKILLGRNSARPGYFSLIAGYVDLGETLEGAFVREVREETGRIVDPDSVRYWGSQPWPQSGSIMVGFTATTEHEEPTLPTDDELLETIWVEASELHTVTGPAPGSIAHMMLTEATAQARRR